MPDQAVPRKAKQDLKEGKSASTAAGEFVHEEIEHVREGKHGARSAQQAIAIGLSEARHAGIPVKAPKGSTSEATRKKAAADTKAGKRSAAGKSASKKSSETSKTRSKATEKALQKEPTNTTSHAALSKHAKKAAAKKANAGQ